MFRHDNDASVPRSDILGPEDLPHPLDHCVGAGIRESEYQDPPMPSGRKPAGVRKVEVVREEKAARVLRGPKDVRVRGTREPLVTNGVDVVEGIAEYVCKPRRQVLVELRLHTRVGTARTGRSSSADAAAKAITARTSAAVMVGERGKDDAQGNTRAAEHRFAAHDRGIADEARVERRTGVEVRHEKEREQR